MSNGALVTAQSRTTFWVLITILTALIIPLGGFFVAALSSHPRFRFTSPAWWLLLAVAAVVLTLQLVGLFAGTSVGGTGSMTGVG